VVIDGGQHGYGNCGHAHADALSLAMSVRGLRLLIDPGTASYTADAALRDRMRSTALHNTLVLDDRSQSIPRGPFHWSHTANARVLVWRTNDGFDYFDGVHDGYRPLEHRRRVLVLHGDLVVVADFVGGVEDELDASTAAAADARRHSHAAAVHWHVDPRWTVDARGRQVTFTRDGERVGLVVPHGLVEVLVGDVASGLGWYSPAYGRVDPSTTVRIGHSGGAPFWMMSVFDLNPDNPVGAVECVPVWAEAGAITHAAALRITRAASVDYALFAEPATGDRGTWRVGEFETDARLLFCRVTGDRPVARVALVDGSLVRTPGRRGLQLALPRVVPDLHIDFSADARAAGAVSGARLTVAGCEQPIAVDRRSAPRQHRGAATRV
jgi:Heparinase II/III-like protein